MTTYPITLFCRYLVGLFAILFLYMLYLARAVVSRLGKVLCSSIFDLIVRKSIHPFLLFFILFL
jgi:hypothetical protein